MTQSKTQIVRSMTGQGHAKEQGELGSVTVEVRTVNNRGFKCTPRVSDTLSSLESKVETLARSLIHRGTVHLNVAWRPPRENLPSIDTDALQAYVEQLHQVRAAAADLPTSIDLSTLMMLPGVIATTREDRRNDQGLWDFVQGAIVKAIENLNLMRATEGGRMADSLTADCECVRERLELIQQLAPRAVDGYRNRLQAKIQRVLEEHDLRVQTVDLLREVQIFADRVDISEEVTRLGSHLKMFVDVLGGENDSQPEPTGRKLDFVIQEMFRETNTIGSKAADAEISVHVVEIKCAIERMRELVQNLE
jgi:uncharacterized protein (TIGR00255 family)